MLEKEQNVAMTTKKEGANNQDDGRATTGASTAVAKENAALAVNAGANRQSLLESFIAHRKRLLRFIGRLVRPDEIEDIVQETFVQSYAAAANQHIHNPQAFMFRTARNLALNSLNRSERKLSSSIEDVDEYDLASGINEVEHQCQSDEQFKTFCRAVAALPVACRKVFILKKVYGLSQNEIADMLDIAPSTVEKHIARGMSATASFMARAGHAQGIERRRNTFSPAAEKEQRT